MWLGHYWSVKWKPTVILFITYISFKLKRFILFVIMCFINLIKIASITEHILQSILLNQLSLFQLIQNIRILVFLLG